MKYLFILLLFVRPVSAESERFYQEKYCTGKIEVVLEDRTRIDCETSHYAIEYDFARKWAESLGQALHYARMTNKQPGIVLIIESEKDCKYVKRAQDNIDFYWLPIDLQTVGLKCPTQNLLQ